MSKENTATQTPVAAPAKAENPVITINPETLRMLGLAFGAQNDIENETKFVHSFLFDAVKARLLYMASANVNAWERAIHKHIDLHPTQTKEQAIEAMLASRKARELKELADQAEVIRAELNK